MSTTDKIKFVNASGKPGRGFYAIDPSGNLVSTVPGKHKGGAGAVQNGVGDLKAGWRWATAAEIAASAKLETDRKAREQKAKG